MRPMIWLGVVLALGLSGCGEPSGGDEEGGVSSTSPGDGTAGPGTAASESTAEPGTGGPGGDPSTTAPTGEPGDGTTLGATTDGGSGSTGSSNDDTAGPVCEPPPPPGNECLECAHANCCVTWQACMNDEPCACVVDCHVVQGNSLGMCTNTCNLDSDLYQGLYFCGQANCLGSCDWDCC